jgi:hypothetical protein
MQRVGVIWIQLEDFRVAAFRIRNPALLMQSNGFAQLPGGVCRADILRLGGKFPSIHAQSVFTTERIKRLSNGYI